MRIIEAIERRPFSLPISEVIEANGDLRFIQNIKDKGYFTVEFQAGKLTLVAGNYIGQIPISNEIVVNVTPKTPINNLTRIISIANQPVRCLDFLKRTYSIESKVSRSLQEAIAYSLVKSLKTLDAEGVYREYLRRDELIPTLRGRLNVPQLVRRKSTHINLPTLPCTFYELSASTPLNKLIRKAIVKLGTLLENESSSSKQLLQELGYFANKFSGVPLNNTGYITDDVRRYLQRNRLPILRNYYLDIIEICLLILDGSTVEIGSTAGTTTMHSFIVNMENAFELYIREIIRHATRIENAGIEILDGNKEGKSFLFSDNKNHDAKPDIIVGSKEYPLAIGDVKYKVKLSEADRYQLIAHACAYNCKIAFFVTLSTGETESSAYIGTVGAIKIYHYKINLDVPDLKIVETELGEWVADLVAVS